MIQSKKFDEIEADVNSQMLQAINWAIAGKGLPTVQNGLGMQENRKVGLRSPEVENYLRRRKNEKPTPY